MNTKFDFETIDMLSKAITQFAFRSGPVEDMHAKNKLTQKDMKALNKYIVNRIAGLLTTISKGDVANVLKLLTFYASLSSDWDLCKPDTADFGKCDGCVSNLVTSLWENCNEWQFLVREIKRMKVYELPIIQDRGVLLVKICTEKVYKSQFLQNSVESSTTSGIEPVLKIFRNNP